MNQIILKYSLDENDYLQHQLYVASKTDRVKSQRLKSLIAIMVLLLGLGFLFYQAGETFIMSMFIFFSILSLVSYPGYLKKHYQKHYRKSVAETYKNRFGVVTTIIFNESNIETINKNMETKINLSDIEKIVETGNYIFVILKSGGSLIIPKSRIENKTYLQTNLKEIADRLKVDFIEELNWEWK